jgi:TonB family protein
LRRPETRGSDEALNKTVDPRTVIETITVEDRAASPPPPPPSSATEANLSAPPPEPQQVPRELRLDGPRILRFYLPAYSKEALAKGIEGEVVVSALFRHDGKIKDVVVNQGLGYGLDERALDAVRRTEFEPARRDERPIDIRAEIVFNFSLMKVTVRVRNVDESTDTKRSLR